MKNEKWFKEIMADIKFGDGFPMSRFYFHPLYKVGVGKETNLDYTFGKNRKLSFKNFRKLNYFSFDAPFPDDSVIFFQPTRQRLIITSQREGKVLKITVCPNHLRLMEGEIKELIHQNQSDFSPYSMKLLSHGTNWIMTSFCSNRESVSNMEFIDLQDLTMGPMVKFYRSHKLEVVTLSKWLETAKQRSLSHPQSHLLEKLISKLEIQPEMYLVNGQLHFDLHHGNVLRDSNRITIIDWEVSHPGLLLIDYLDFFRRFTKKNKVNSLKIIDAYRGSDFFRKYQSWMKNFNIEVPDHCEEFLLYIYTLERTLIYFEKWQADRLKDESGFEYKIIRLLI